jgi:carboxypeptidase Q
MKTSRRVSSVALVVLAASFAAPLRAQGDDAARVIALGRSESRVMEHLDTLTNRIGPRLTGSHGFDNACRWALTQFEAFGLSNCHLEKWGEFPVGFNRGPASGRMLTPDQKELHFGTNAWTAGTHGPTSGPAVLAPTNEAELEAVRGKLAGAWVVIAPPRSPDAPAARADSATPVEAGARTNRDASDRADKPASGDATKSDKAATSDKSDGDASARRRAARETATADRVFRDKLEKVYDEAGIAGTIRSGRNDLILTGGNSKIAFDKLPARPAITLLAAEHAEIVDDLKAKKPVQLEFDVRNWFEKGPIALNNVIAEIPGTEKPDEVVIVGGHLDSWDGATGATDNGTGVATTLEAARLLVKAGVKPKRTIRFMLYGGEEQGLLGSAAYVKAHKDELPKISAVLVHDGGTNYCAGITATPPMMPLLEPIFASVKDLDPKMPFEVHEVKGLSGGGSDHASFLAADVPGFFWSQSGRANYNHTHHTQYDTYDAAIPEYQRESAIVIAVGALGIANLPVLLPRENLRAPGGGGRRALGVQLSDDMTIEEVVEDGIAAKVGLKVGDRLVKIGAEDVADNDELRTVLRAAPEKTSVTVLRAGKPLEVAIELPPPPAPTSAAARRLGVRFGEGLSIDVVTPGGVGDQAGLQMGDRIVKAAEKAVEGTKDLDAALENASGAVRLRVQRGSGAVDVSLTLPVPP